MSMGLASKGQAKLKNSKVFLVGNLKTKRSRKVLPVVVYNVPRFVKLVILKASLALTQISHA